MSGQSSGKGGYGQSYGQPYGSSPYGGSYGYGYPGQQGSFFSTGGSTRPGTGYQTLPYPIPDGGIPQGAQNPLIMDSGTLFGSNFTGYGGPTGAQIMAGGNPLARGGGMTNFGSAGSPATYGANVLQGGAATGAALGQYNGFANTGLSSQGTTQAQQGMGIGTTPQGTLSFSPSGSLNQISASTASLMGARNNGQGQWVNAQGQVIGLV